MQITYEAVMAEWLRRWTRNPMGFSRVGSNPTHSGILFFITFFILFLLLLFALF